MFKHNTYFDGNVQSLGFEDNNGKASVGVMNPGIYEFGTSQDEIMTFISGKVEVKLPTEDKFIPVGLNESFEIEANQKFGVNILEVSSYICLYR